MVEEKSLILDEEKVKQKIKRIAFEIYENNFQEQQIILAGIYDEGYLLAEMLQSHLHEISPLKIKLLKVELDKVAPLQGEIKLDCEDIDEELTNQTIVMVDDVLNTGRTMIYSLKPFLKVRVKKIEIAVLVNRSHTQFPISCKYTGYELSTTINEHVQVVLEEGEMGVYLH